MGWSDTMKGDFLSLVEDMESGQNLYVVDNVPGGGEFNFDLGVMSSDAISPKFFIDGEEQDIDIGEGDKEENTFVLPEEEDVEIRWEFPSRLDNMFMLDIYRYEPPPYTPNVIISEEFSENTFDEPWVGDLTGTIVDESFRKEAELHSGQELYQRNRLSFLPQSPRDVYVHISSWTPDGATRLLKLMFLNVDSTGIPDESHSVDKSLEIRLDYPCQGVRVCDLEAEYNNDFDSDVDIDRIDLFVVKGAF